MKEHRWRPAHWAWRFNRGGPNGDDFESAFALSSKAAEALVVGPGHFCLTPATSRRVRTKKSSAVDLRVERPGECWGLIAYGVNIPQVYRRAAHYVDRILRGTKPGDLPVEQPTKFDLVVNLRTATALGRRSAVLLLRADEVIR